MNNQIEPIAKYISILYRAGNMYFNQNFEALNIGYGQYPFLVFLYYKDAVTQEEMSNELYIDKGTTAKALKKLQENGYVTRHIDDKDKRAYKVQLTDEGKRVTKEVFNILRNWNALLTSDFTEEEQVLALKLLKKMLENKNKLFNKGDCE
jgi:DNA-binding MarR family transcriptional regulator